MMSLSLRQGGQTSMAVLTPHWEALTPETRQALQIAAAIPNLPPLTPAIKAIARVGQQALIAPDRGQDEHLALG